MARRDEKNTTAYWAKLLEKWLEENYRPGRKKLPPLPKDLKAGYAKARDFENKIGKYNHTPIKTPNGRLASLEGRGKGSADPWKMVYLDTKVFHGAERRAEEYAATVSFEERLDYYNKNLVDPADYGYEGLTREELAKQKAADDVAKRNAKHREKRRLGKTTGTKHIYEHLNPLAYGGFEHDLNTAVADDPRNAIKSSRVPSQETLRQNRIPTNRSAVIQAELRGQASPTSETFDAVYDDVVENQRDTAWVKRQQTDKLKIKRADMRQGAAIREAVKHGGSYLDNINALLRIGARAVT